MEYVTTKMWHSKKVVERIRIILILNGNKRIILISNEFPVIVVNSRITYSIHACYIFHKQTKTHTFLPLSRDSKIFVHLGAAAAAAAQAPGRRLVGAMFQQHETAQ
jgi:hypothetical protein